MIMKKTLFAVFLVGTFLCTTLPCIAYADSKPKAYGTFLFPKKIADQIAEKIGTSDYIYYLEKPINYTVEWGTVYAGIITEQKSYYVWFRPSNGSFETCIMKNIDERTFSVSADAVFQTTLETLISENGGKLFTAADQGIFTLRDMSTYSSDPKWAWNIAHALNEYQNVQVQFNPIALSDAIDDYYVCTLEEITADGFAKGDFNGDNTISTEDAQNVLTVYADTLAGNTPQLLTAQTKAADVNADGKIDSTDAQLILLYYVQNTLAGTPTTWEELLAQK